MTNQPESGIPIPPAVPPVVTPPATPPVPNPIEDKMNEMFSKLESSFEEKFASINEKLDGANPPPPPPATQEDGWTPSTWDDIPKLVDEKATALFDKKLAEREAAEQAAVKAREDKDKAINEQFDKVLTELETAGKIPKVTNESDPADPGKQARKELYGIGVRFGTPDLKAAMDIKEALAQAGQAFDPTTQKIIKVNPAPMGANAPVGSSSNSGANNSGGPDYKTIHSLSMDQLARKFMGS